MFGTVDCKHRSAPTERTDESILSDAKFREGHPPVSGSGNSAGSRHLDLTTASGFETVRSCMCRSGESNWSIARGVNFPFNRHWPSLSRLVISTPFSPDTSTASPERRSCSPAATYFHLSRENAASKKPIIQRQNREYSDSAASHSAIANSNRAPPSGPSVTRTLQPCASAIPATIESPNPVPLSLDVTPCSKTLFLFSGGIPSPSSST